MPRRKFKLCKACHALMEWDWQERAWLCPTCGYDYTVLGIRVRQQGVGIRYGRGFEQFDYLHTSGMRDYLDYQERTGKRAGTEVRVREGE